jgi:hypothetical protein
MSKKPSRTARVASPRAADQNTPSWHDAWFRQSNVRQHVIAFLILVLVAVVFYAPIIFSEKQIIAGDTVNWRGMAQSMIEYEEETGDVALWAGRTFAGMPGYMISPELTVPQVDILIRELRKWGWPTSNLLLMLFGMYVLAWYVTRDSLASIVGAVAYGLSTYMPVILIAGHNSKFIALAWAPWMLVAFIHALRKHTLMSGLLFAVALAANLRAGHVQITYYVTLAAGIWWLVEGINATKSGDQKSFIKATGILVLGSVLGLMMVAEPYLLHAELAPFTTRGSATGGAAAGMTWAYAMAWSQGIGELLTLLVSNTFGGAGPTYWGPKTFTGGPHHFGGIVIALGILAGWKLRDRITLSLLIGIVVFIAFSLGENLAVVNRVMFNLFPMFSAFRVPETWLSIAALLAALMASRGIASLRLASFKTRNLWAEPSIRVFAGLFGVVLMLIVFGNSVLSFEKPFEREQILAQIQRQYPTISPSDPQVVSVINQEITTRKTARIEAFDSDAKRVALFLFLALSLVVLLVRGTIPYSVAAAGLFVLVVVDLNGVGHRYLTDEVLSMEKSVEEKVPEYQFDTFLKQKREEAGGDGTFRVLSLEFGREPSTNARPSFHYESMGGYSAAKLRNYQDFFDHILLSQSGIGINPAALNLANIKYVVAEQGFPGFEPVFTDEQTKMIVSRNPFVLPRAFLVDRLSSVATREEGWAILQSSEFDPAVEAIVLGGDPELIARVSGASDSTGLTHVRAVQYSAQNMVFEVESDRERLLVVSEVYYKPGWKAMVGDKVAEIIEVDQFLRGIPVPAGNNKVTLTFAPPSFQQGRIISGIGVLITYGLLLFFGAMTWKRTRTEQLL